MRRTCRKKSKGDQSELEAKWLAQNSFPFQTRGAIEQANGQTREPGINKTILLPHLLCKGAPWVGKEIYVFCLKLPPPIFYSFPPSLSILLSFRACYTGLSKQNLIDPHSHPSPSTLTLHPSPSPSTLTLHPHPSPTTRVLATPDISSLALPGSPLPLPRVSAYAYDSSLIVSISKSILEIFNVYSPLERVTGKRLKLRKCKGLWLGAWNGATDSPIDIE